MSSTTAQPAAFTGDPMRQIARGSALSGAGAVVAAVGGVALVLVITWAFRQELAGTFLAATALFMIVGSLAQLGTDVGLVRYLSADAATGQQHRLFQMLRISLLPVLTVAVLCAVALWYGAPRLADTIGTPAVRAETIGVLRALTPFVPVSAVYGTLLAATRSRGSMRHTVLVDSVLRTGGQPILLGATVLLGWSASAAAVAWAVPYAVGVVVCCYVLFKQGRQATAQRRQTNNAETADLEALPASAAVSVETSSGAQFREFWAFTGARAVSGVVAMIWRRFDVILVAALAGPAEAAIYGTAIRFLVLGALGIQAIQMTLSPQLSRLFAHDDIEGARQLYRTATLWMMIATWPIYIATGAAASLVIPIFGREDADYSAGAPVVVVLSAAMLIATACGSVDAVLLMSGRSLLSLVNAVVTLLVNVVLDVILIPPFGIMGAAVGWACSIVVRNVMTTFQVNRLMRMSPFSRQAFYVAVVALLCFAIAPATLALSDQPRWTLGVSLVLGGLVYLGWLWRSRRALQLNTFAHAFSRKTNKHAESEGTGR